MSKLLFTEGGNNIQKDNLPTEKLQKKKVFRSTPVTTLVRPFNLNKQQKKRKKRNNTGKGRGERGERVKERAKVFTLSKGNKCVRSRLSYVLCELENKHAQLYRHANSKKRTKRRKGKLSCGRNEVRVAAMSQFY